MSTSDNLLDAPANRPALLAILREVRKHLVKGSFVTLRLTLQIQDGAIQRDMMVEPVYKVRVPDAAGGAGN
jgi:hypothetical protein